MKNTFFEKINKIDKPLARLFKEKETAQISKIRNEREVTNDNTKTQKVTINYYTPIRQTGRNGKFLEIHNFPKLNQEEIENLNRPITSNRTE